MEGFFFQIFTSLYIQGRTFLLCIYIIDVGTQNYILLYIALFSASSIHRFVKYMSNNGCQNFVIVLHQICCLAKLMCAKVFMYFSCCFIFNPDV